MCGKLRPGLASSASLKPSRASRFEGPGATIWLAGAPVRKHTNLTPLSRLITWQASKAMNEITSGINLLPALLTHDIRRALPPSTLDGARRFAIYARFSAHEHRESSVERQVEACRACAARLGGGVTHVFVDQEVSGAFMTDRNGLKAMLEAAEQHAFDGLVVEDIDRLSRDVADLSSMWRRFQVLGITLHSAMRGEVDLMTISIVGFLSAEQRRILSLRTQAGRSIKAAQGLFPTGPCFGYEKIPLVPGAIRIHPSEAVTVSRIFRMARDGLNANQIARTLNAEGIPGPAGASWTRSSLRSSDLRRPAILQNPRYLGLSIYGRTKGGREPGSGARQFNLRDPSEWIVRSISALQIVDQETWTAVNEKMRATAGKPSRERRRAKHFAGRLLRCAGCGAKMSATWYSRSTRYVCSARRRTHSCRAPGSIMLEKVDAFLEGALIRLFDHPLLESAHNLAWKDEAACILGESKASLRKEKAAIALALRQLEATFDLTMVAGYSGEWISQKRRSLEQQLQFARAHAACLQRSWTAPTPVAVATSLRQLFANLRAHDGRVNELEEALASIPILVLFDGRHKYPSCLSIVRDRSESSPS